MKTGSCDSLFFPHKFKKLHARFTILETLSTSEFCQVFKIQCKASSQQFSLKMIEVKGKSRPFDEPRKFFEIDSLVHCDDGENVYRDSWVEDGAVLIIMRLFRGSINRIYPFMSLQEKLSAFCQIARQLASMHRGGFVHLDVKPQNVLFEYSRKGLKVFLLDFGHSRGPRDASTPVRGGDLLTLAPELNYSETLEEIDLTKCDTYSLGALFLDMMSSKLNRRSTHESLR